MERILIIEDERGIRESLKEILELAGYYVNTAKNGKEGYQCIVDFKPQLVLCDVRMPIMDGFELLEMINEKMSKSTAPNFIFLTAQVEKSAKNIGKELGAVAYINKPFDHIELLTIIKDQIKSNKNSHVYYSINYNQAFQKYNSN